ncbi:AzlC family ABC transporter permease [Streptomyces mobaraensis NBRC 13819 = DSM 40847]|uniref:AzlC family protein n=1 Tax=Streptomyces mobaraensis (strain ATCC 29032 / DSM 40847 / JCM 4168 / NBRC 13819 / NCIMB 11159 / IPCR 16-22) TaxID=1223523 RepID=M3B8N3_STRM1|nr:AzlC family ABC transporter permease [Streptomyces mobaraensis]EMF02358.1 AzlC family protein [Streptomyces mobaraensis NBRC 13819 = DSM 40847]QTT76989.1 AzlC family ABC transporter permease [Streptomyces mobaraensis NBRC 13819 = DSM 40847]
MPVERIIPLRSARDTRVSGGGPFLQGAAHALGAAVGYLPVAAAFGAIATRAGLPLWLSVLMSGWVYAGAAQMAGLQALTFGQHPLLVAAGMLVVNLRHIPMSLAAGPLLRRARPVGRLALAHTLTDESFALDLGRPDRPTGFRYGVHAACWTAWVGGTAVGAALGPVVPQDATAFALPALFVALAVDALRGVDGWGRVWVPVMGIAVVLGCRPAGGFAELVAMVVMTVLLAVADRLRVSVRTGGGEAV